jgi:hypothetical protein
MLRDGSVTERELYMPVPASLCMQDVKRGEGAPWVVCGHREGPSQAWPAVRMQGRGESRERLGVMPPQASPEPQYPCLDTNA